MPLRRPSTLLLAVLALALVAIAPASARVPSRFVGVGIDGPFFYPQFDQSGQMALMRSDGVRSVRTLIDWQTMQPYKSFSALPAGTASHYVSVNGVPTNFATPDAFMAVAAAHNLTVLPVVEYAPTWDALKPHNFGSPPKTYTPYGHLLTALVKRYGPSGSFWKTHPGLPKVPITAWQVWNEPNFNAYWDQQPFQPSYVKMLKVAHDAIKAADRHATVVLAGLTNFSWVYLQGIYKIRGAKNLFDAVAAHPYTRYPSGVITILQNIRKVMNHYGDRRKAIWATEISWPSAAGKANTQFENNTTESGQAKNTSAVIKLLAKDRSKLNIAAFYYYNWIGNETLPGARVDPFNFAGLERFLNGVGVQVKPALAAFASAAKSVEK